MKFEHCKYSLQVKEFAIPHQYYRNIDMKIDTFESAVIQNTMISKQF